MDKTIKYVSRKYINKFNKWKEKSILKKKKFPNLTEFHSPRKIQVKELEKSDNLSKKSFL